MPIRTLAIRANAPNAPNALRTHDSAPFAKPLRAWSGFQGVGPSANLPPWQRQVGHQHFLSAYLNTRAGSDIGMPKHPDSVMHEQLVSWEGRVKRRLPKDHFTSVAHGPVSTTEVPSDEVFIEPTIKWVRTEGRTNNLYIAVGAPRMDVVSVKVQGERWRVIESVSTLPSRLETDVPKSGPTRLSTSGPTRLMPGTTPSAILSTRESTLPEVARSNGTGIVAQKQTRSHDRALVSCNWGRGIFAELGERCVSVFDQAETQAPITTAVPLDMQKLVWPNALLFPVSNPLWLLRFPQHLPWRVAAADATRKTTSISGTISGTSTKISTPFPPQGGAAPPEWRKAEASSTVRPLHQGQQLYEGEEP